MISIPSSILRQGPEARSSPPWKAVFNYVVGLLLLALCLPFFQMSHNDAQKYVATHRVPQYLKMGRKIHLTSQGTFSPKAVLAGNPFDRQRTFICFLLNPLVNPFTLGLYLQYWARHPSLA